MKGRVTVSLSAGKICVGHAERQARALAKRMETEHPGWRVEVSRADDGEWCLCGESADGTEGFAGPAALLRGVYLKSASHGLGGAPGRRQ